MGKNQHVVPHPDGWAVKGAGNPKATKVTETQKEAITVARELLKTKNLNYSSIERMGNLENETVTAMILKALKGKLTSPDNNYRGFN